MPNPFRPVAISISPNIVPGYFSEVFEQLLKPAAWKEGEHTVRLEEKFQDIFGAQAISFSSGRSSLWAVLKAINLKSGDEVLMQAYTCIAVPEPVLALGGKPVFVDINPSTFNMDPPALEAKITPKARALIIQHTFGIPAEVESLITIARKHNLLVIEDCAHSLGARVKGELTGKFGDISFFSFGRDKAISSVYGGMAIINNKQLTNPVRSVQKELPIPSATWILKQLLHPLITEAALATYRLLDLGKIILLTAQKIGLASKAVIPTEWQGQLPEYFPSRMPNALAALALQQLDELASINEQRKQTARYYLEALRGLPLSLPSFNEQTEPIWLRFPVRTEKALGVIQYGKKRGVLLGDWYRHVIDPKEAILSSIGYQRGSCPKAELAAAHSLNLPTHPRLTPPDARFVVEIVKRALKA